ncbi:hypothetical protein HDF16_001337 [Granulicella aggregans]|uniref:TonB C-terminal domain-containing protein n=1 Tax=Granulicella aggregans TaxID=474949 RepID=A0A7W7ZBD4_9BACT|nr:energy transducer TonB [Granulicella aggregans]MBB5056652.1 hypothetical protein [Granulicella aggregans]
MTSLLKHFPLVAILGASCTASAADPAELAKRLHHAAEMSSLDDPALKPWHLKVTFQLLEKKGPTTEEGTIEEWWSGESDKRIYTSPSYNATEIRRDNEVYRTKDQSPTPYLLGLLRDEVVHPVADDAEVNDAVPELHVEGFGKVKLDCIMLNRQVRNLAYPPLGMFPTYCLSQDTDRLRGSLRNGSENVARNAIGMFQGRAVAVDLSVSEQTGLVAKGHIATLAASPQDEHFFDLDNTMGPKSTDPVKVELKVIAKSKISGEVPVFPIEDKNSRTSGAVHIHVLIGTDGHIHQLSLIDAPSPTLAASALDSVRTWVYKPYLVNGLPCSVDTIVTVNYAFGD